MPVRSTIAALFLGVSLALAAQPSARADETARNQPGLAPDTQLWGIGSTAWLCFQPPCGWRGVFPVDDEGTRGRPLSIHDEPDPPAMRGMPADLARIRETYADHGCILAEGHFDYGILKVRRIAGDC